MTNIFLNDAKVYLATVNLDAEMDRNYQRPSVIVHANLAKLGLDENIVTSTIEVTEMASDNPMNPMVNISFYHQKDHISFRMPMQFYAVSFSLSKLSLYGLGGVGVYLVDSERYPIINPAVVLPVESIKHLLVFDPKKELQYSNALRGNVHTSMTNSLSHIPWVGISLNNEGSPMEFVNKTVLGKSLRLALSFANGNIPFNLFYEEEGRNLTYQSDEALIIPDEDRYYHLDTIMERVKLSSPRYMSAYPDAKSDDDEDDEMEENDILETNLIFNQLVSDLDIKVSTDNTTITDSKLTSWEQNTMLWDSNASESWHPLMISIYELCRDEGVLKEIESIINMLITGEYDDLIGKFDHQLVEIASALYFAMQARKLSAYTGEPVDDIIIGWFSNDDRFMSAWMLEEMGEELFYLDNKNVVRLFKYKDGYKGLFAPAISAFTIFAGYLLDSSSLFEGMEREEIIAEINQYKFDHPSANIVKSVLSGYVSNIEAYEPEYLEARENGVELPYRALLEQSVSSMVATKSAQGANVDYWAEAFSLVVPFIAEMVVSRTETKGTEEWYELKQSYIVNLLSDFNTTGVGNRDDA